MLYTRKGDGGTSGLFGTKERVPKDSPIYEALGTLDELNSLLGFCRSFAATHRVGVDVPGAILKAQQCLFVAQAEIAGSDEALLQEHVSTLEEIIEEVEARIENPHAFVIPGATELSGLLDYARAVSRRAERTVVAVSRERAISAPTSSYLNRLSSLLYALARYAAMAEGTRESSPDYLTQKTV